MKKIILLILALVALIGGYFAYDMYNKEHTNVAKTEAAHTVTASDLLSAFQEDNDASMLKYGSKVIAVSGPILSLDMSNEKSPNVVLDANGDNGFIRCSFKPEELDNVLKLKVGIDLKVKGECSGMLAPDPDDLIQEYQVSLANCIVIE